jgi:hypothetical protein
MQANHLSEQKKIISAEARNPDESLPESVKHGIARGTAMILELQEMVLIKLWREEFQSAIDENKQYVIIPASDKWVADTLRSLWGKVQRIHPDHQLQQAKDTWESQGRPLDAVAFSYNQVVCLVDLAKVTEKVLKSTSSQYITVKSKKSAPPPVLSMRLYDEISKHIYALLDPLAQVVREDEIIHAQDERKRLKESKEGWNAYEATDPEIYVAMITFNNVFVQDALIQVFVDNPYFSAFRFATKNEKRPVVLITFYKEQWVTEGNSLEENISSCIQSLRIKLGIYARDVKLDDIKADENILSQNSCPKATPSESMWSGVASIPDISLTPEEMQELKNAESYLRMNLKQQNNIYFLVPLDNQREVIMRGIKGKVDSLLHPDRVELLKNVAEKERVKRGIPSNAIVMDYTQLNYLVNVLDKNFNINLNRPLPNKPETISSPHMTKRANPLISKIVYQLFDPVAALFPEGQIVLSQSQNKRLKESQFGWNVWEAKDPTIYIAMLIFKKGISQNHLIEAFANNDHFSAFLVTTMIENLPAVLVTFKREDIQTNQRALEESISQCINRLKEKLATVTGDQLAEENRHGIR